MPGQRHREGQQSMEQTEEGYSITSSPQEVTYNSDVQRSVHGNVYDRADSKIVGGYYRLYDNIDTALGLLSDALALPASDDAVPAGLLEVTGGWVLEQLKGSVLGAMDARLPIGTALGGMADIYQGVEAATKEATAASEALSFHTFVGQLTASVSRAKTQLHISATPWLETLQGYCNDHPESAQMIYDYVLQWGDQIDVLLNTSASMSAQLGRLAAQWAAYQGGHIELRLLGSEMSERELHLHAPYSDQLGGMLHRRGADLRHSGLDVRVTWWPDPMFGLARLEGVIPAEGDPYVIGASANLFSAEDVQRFDTVLRDCTTTVA